MGRHVTRKRLPKADVGVIRVIGYVRVSKTKKEEKDGISPGAQKKAILAACRRKGYVVVRWIEDLDKTGRNFARAGVQEAIRAVQDGEADVVMVWRWSRFGRTSTDYRVNMDRVEKAGGFLEAALEEVDPRTSSGRLMRGLFIELATFESEKISEGWKEAQAIRLDNGLPANGRVRFGYAYHRCTGECPGSCKTEYRVDPDTGPVLASLYRRYLDGESLPKLRDWCTATGQPRERGGTWCTSSVADVLDGGFGAGLLHSGGRTRNGKWEEHVWTAGAHEPVITEEEWERYRMRRKRLRTIPSRHKAPTYTLTGLVVCGQCGGNMFAASSARGPGYLYRCNNAQNTGACPGVWIVRSAVEAAVLDALEPYAVRLEEAARKALARPRPRPKETVPAGAADARRRLKESQEGLARLVKSVAAGVLSEDEVAKEAAALRKAAAAAERAIEAAAGETSGGRALPPTRLRALREQWDDLPVATRRGMVIELFERVVVAADKTITVVPKY